MKTEKNKLPIFVMKENTKFKKSYRYPNTGKVKFSFRASGPVDLIFSTPEIIDGIGGKNDVNQLESNGITNKISNATKFDNFIFPAPHDWRNGFTLFIGNPNSFDVAIYYKINEGGDPLDGISDENS